MAQFKRGDFSTCVAPRPGRHKTVTTPEIIYQIHDLILEDSRISAKSIAEQLGISLERVGSIIHEDLDTRKVIAAAETWLDGQTSDFFFLSGLQNLEKRAKKCIELRGEYVE